MRLAFFSRRMRMLRALRSAANAAAGRGDWADAARLRREIAAATPAQPALLVQLGHALKEAGDRGAALLAYRDAADRMPCDLDARLHLSSLLRLVGDSDRAAQVYAEMLAIDPTHPAARRGAIELGRRDLIEGMGGLDPTRRLTGALHDTLLAADAAIQAASTSTQGYDRFRRANPLLAPPGDLADGTIAIAIDARQGSAAMLHATLTGLQDLVGVRWQARVDLGEALANHPVAGFASIDPRIVIDGPPLADGPVLALASGTILEPWSAAWLLAMLARTGALAAYGDHDAIERDWLTGEVRSAPWFYEAHDPIGLATAPAPRAILFARGAGAGTDPVAALCAMADAVHVPRVLASGYVAPPSARNAPGGGDDADAKVSVAAPLLDQGEGRDIAIIIPTRDESALLIRAIDTMRAQAVRAERLRFVVVDNRSRDEATRVALANLAATGVMVVPFDEAFNWSRANMLGAARTDAPLLVFANNDVEMLTQGWDVRLQRDLADSRVGAVGAKLIYPSGGMQHAGILFATAPRSLGIHDGLGSDAAAGGPGGRWQRRRTVAAVTGAFVAMRREVLEAIDGFDERLFVAYGDIDLCLRVRAAGKLVVYQPAISLIHHESATRGLNRSADQVGWDEEELRVLVRRWGAALRIDPAYNPQWAVGGLPFDGFREPPVSEILRHVDLARGGSSWRVEPVSDG